MAIYTLHYVLFSLTKLINIRLLLDGSYELIWQPKFQLARLQLDNLKLEGNTTHHETAIYQLQTNSSVKSEESKFIYAQTLIFISSLVALILSSTLSLNWADRLREHRRYLLSSLASGFIFYSLYLYLINSISETSTVKESIILKLALIITIGLVVTGTSWAHALITTLADCFAINSCINSTETSRDARYMFITYLMIGTISSIFASLTICQLFITVPMIEVDTIGYVSLLLITGILILGLELLVLLIMTNDDDGRRCNHRELIQPDSKVIEGGEKTPILGNLWKSSLFRKLKLTLDASPLSGHKRQAYSYNTSLKALPPDILSVSIDCTEMGTEITKTVDDDEWDNSVDLFYIYPGFYRANCPANVTSKKTAIDNNSKQQHSRSLNLKQEADHQDGRQMSECYDKSKFCLYDDYVREDKALKQRRFTSSSLVSTTSTLQMSSGFARQDDGLYKGRRETKLHCCVRGENCGAGDTENKTNSSTLEILMTDGGSFGCQWAFMQNCLILTLIGSIYQANQFCLLVDYLRYLTRSAATSTTDQYNHLSLGTMINQHHSLSLPYDHHQQSSNILTNHSGHAIHSVLQQQQDQPDQFVTATIFKTKHLPIIVWAELLCASYIVQYIARVICLNYINSIALRFGAKKTLATILILALTLPCQFLLNVRIFNITSGSNDIDWLSQLAGMAGKTSTPPPPSTTTTTMISIDMQQIVVISQLMLIQFQIGLVGAASDYLITEFALQHSQQVSSYKQSRFIIEPHTTIQATIHGLLRGSFDLLGGALMSAIMLLMNLTSSQPFEHISLTWIIISIWPAVTLMILLVLLIVYQLELTA